MIIHWCGYCSSQLTLSLRTFSFQVMKMNFCYLYCVKVVVLRVKGILTPVVSSLTCKIFDHYSCIWTWNIYFPVRYQAHWQKSLGNEWNITFKSIWVLPVINCVAWGNELKLTKIHLSNLHKEVLKIPSGILGSDFYHFVIKTSQI